MKNKPKCVYRTESELKQNFSIFFLLSTQNENIQNILKVINAYLNI